jgi:drug/metabolite transporter (DMT)-like permease
MFSWYIFALLALILLGTQRFLYKVSAERKCNTAWTTFSFMATVALLSVILFFALGEPVTNIRFLVFIALLNSGAFLVATISNIEALKHIPASIAYPIIRLNVIVVVMFSILFFEDRLSFYQIAGVILAIAVIIIFARDLEEKDTSQGNIKRGLILVFVCLFSGAVAAISSKFAALYSNKMAFIAISYTAATILSLGLRGKLKGEEENSRQRDAVIIGLTMGVINIAGFYSFLKALSKGPLSIIASITGMHFVIAIILSVVIYKEKLKASRILGIFLTIISILLLRR